MSWHLGKRTVPQTEILPDRSVEIIARAVSSPSVLETGGPARGSIDRLEGRYCRGPRPDACRRLYFAVKLPGPFRLLRADYRAHGLRSCGGNTSIQGKIHKEVNTQGQRSIAIQAGKPRNKTIPVV
jgi:hypothetical protein